MAGLTVSEKAYWKDRIRLRIDARISQIAESAGPGFMQLINKKARALAIDRLGLGSFELLRTSLTKSALKLHKERIHLLAKMQAHINGTEPEDEVVGNSRYYDEDASTNRIDITINTAAHRYTPEVLAESEAGLRILKLLEEKESLLDTVWLASSSDQIKELWGMVNTLLGRTLTDLETGAKNLPPIVGS